MTPPVFVRYILTKQCLWHYVQVIWRAAKLLVVPNETVHRWTIRTWFDIDVYKNNGILLQKLFWPTVRQNCSNDRDFFLKFEAEGWEFAKFMRSLEQFIQIVKGQNNFWQQNAFLTCSWRFLRSNKIRTIRIQIGKKILGFRNMC